MKNRSKGILTTMGLVLYCLGVQSGFAQGTQIKTVAPVTQSVKSASMMDIGVGETIIVVFVVLVLTLLSFRLISNMMMQKEKKPEIAKPLQDHKIATQISSEEGASVAIAMALYLYTNQIHDQENPVITMIKVSRTYSPWSSKIYGLRKSPR